MNENKIAWSAISIRQFNSPIDYIADDSSQNAYDVHRKMLEKLEKVAAYPTICPPDKYKFRNNNDYRAFTLFRYRFTYRIKPGFIEILRIRHTSMKPKYY